MQTAKHTHMSRHACAGPTHRAHALPRTRLLTRADSVHTAQAHGTTAHEHTMHRQRMPCTRTPRRGAHACRPPPPCTAPGASHGLARPRTWRGGRCLPRTDCISRRHGPARPRMRHGALAHASHTGMGMHMHALHLAHVCCTPGACRDATRVVWECTHMQRHRAHMLHTRCTGRCAQSVQAELPRVHVACTRIAHMVHAWHMHPHYTRVHPVPMTHTCILSPHPIHLHPITYVCTSPLLHV